MGTVSIMVATTLLLISLTLDYESRTLADLDANGAPVAFLVTERIMNKDGYTLVSRSVDKESGGVSYLRSDFSPSGVPRMVQQEGFWNDQWNVLTSTFAKEGAVQSINGEVTRSKFAADRFKNPTTLWFWKTHPRRGQSVLVDFLAQNTISTFKIRFTYEGDETQTLQGRKVTLHRVRETPQSSRDGVFTIWWYDDQGMGVKRYHKTPEHEYRYELLSWR